MSFFTKFKKKPLSSEDKLVSAMLGEDGWSINEDPEVDIKIEKRCRTFPITYSESHQDKVTNSTCMITVPANITAVQITTLSSFGSELKGVEPEYHVDVEVESLSIASQSDAVNTATFITQNSQERDDVYNALTEAMNNHWQVIIKASCMWGAENGVHLHDCSAEITKMSEEQYNEELDSKYA